MSPKPTYDAVILGSGPNGLSAAITLAQAGLSVLVLEAADTFGGGMRSRELTLPGFVHDVCSAVHTTGILSPFFCQLPLADHGLRWCTPPLSAAHPLPDGQAALLAPSIAETCANFGTHDSKAYRHLVEPFLHNPQRLFIDLLAPLQFPSQPWTMARFGLLGLRSATRLINRFHDTPAKALFAGCAAHSILPLDRLITAAVGMVFTLSAHVKTWPVVQGGSQMLANSLVSYFHALGGQTEAQRPIRSFADLPPAKAYLFDLSPHQLLAIAGTELPAGYRKRLQKFRYGPGVFKIDWALSGPIPWTAKRCNEASTVHVGGTFEEIAAAEKAVWAGEHPERPFVMVCQQSQFDTSRAPQGQHTGYAYCHVPHGSTMDMTSAIEHQLERFAPGFRDLILARYTMTSPELEAYNANYVGGAITGGVADIFQLFFRPVLRLDPYRTPNPKIYICSASTPPGGGVHGMCGYYAAKSVLRRFGKKPIPLLPAASERQMGSLPSR